MIVAAAGIITNIFLAALSALALHWVAGLDNSIGKSIASLFLINMVAFNIVLAVFNALPIPPLDGSKILLGWSDNPKVQKFLDSYKEGSVFIIFFAFVLPVIARYLGFDFNPFGAYLIKTSKFFISLLL